MQNVKLQLIVTGAHLEAEMGRTVDEIEQDGIPITARLHLNMFAAGEIDVVATSSQAIHDIARTLMKLEPGILVILGDRYEMLAAAFAATLAGVPIAHIHGGETTEGAFDDAFRHAISKMSHLHFVAAEPYRQRVIQMGEAPETVWTVGAPGLDQIDPDQMASREELESFLNLHLGRSPLLITFHPETATSSDPMVQVDTLITALQEFKPLSQVITGVNADPGRDVIATRLQDYARRHKQNVRIVDNLGQYRYLGLLSLVGAMVGNSSSALIEAPTLKAPAINIGERQRGRLRAKSVIDCPCTHEDIVAAIRRSLTPEFRAGLLNMINPYGQPGAGAEIASKLVTHKMAHILSKSFYDLEVIRGSDGTHI